MDNRLPPSPCPTCGKLNDSATSVDGEDNPSPGDIAVCLYCRSLMAFANDLTLRPLTDAEMIEVAGDKRILHAMRAILQATRAIADKERKP